MGCFYLLYKLIWIIDWFVLLNLDVLVSSIFIHHVCASGENQRYRSRAVVYSSVVSRALVRVASSCARSRARGLGSVRS